MEKSPDQSAAGDGAMPTMSLQGGRRVLLVVPGLAGHPRKVGLDSFNSTEHHSWDPLAGEIVFSGFVWSVCQSLCSPTSPRFGGALDGCPVVSPFLDKFAISKAAQWQRRLHCYSDFPIPLRLSCSADVETDMEYISGGRRMGAFGVRSVVAGQS